MNLSPVRAAHERLLATLATMTDEQAGEPSRLAGWTRAMVATHIARNAESNARMVDAALRGERRAQYPGGEEERSRGVEAGRGRTAAELLADNRAMNDLWLSVFERVTDWTLEVQAGVGPRPLSQRVESRLLEVEVHHADLGLAYGFRDWPVEFAEHQVARRADWIRRAGDGHAGRWRVGPHTIDLGPGPEGAVDAEPQALLAWLMGRETALSAGLVVTGDERVASLPEEFPFP